FFQAEDGIRGFHVTGVQTCALPIFDRCLATGSTPAILSIHSFTESWKGISRPWHVGVLYGEDDRLAGPFLEALCAENDLIVGAKIGRASCRESGVISGRSVCIVRQQ